MGASRSVFEASCSDRFIDGSPVDRSLAAEERASLRACDADTVGSRDGRFEGLALELLEAMEAQTRSRPSYDDIE